MPNGEPCSHSFNCLTRAANRDASHALVHFVGHLWPTCWILLANYLLELYWQLTLSPAFAPSSKVTSPRQTIMTIYPSRIKTPQTFDWVCPFALHISRKQWPFCWDSSEYIWIIQNHTRSKFKKVDSRLSTLEKDGKGASPVPPFQVTRDELLGQQLPWGDHQEQNRHVAGGKAVGTSELASTHDTTQASVAAQVQTVCVDWAWDIKGFQGAASEGPTKTCDSFQRLCFRFFSSMTNCRKSSWSWGCTSSRADTFVTSISIEVQ